MYFFRQIIVTTRSTYQMCLVVVFNPSSHDFREEPNWPYVYADIEKNLNLSEKTEYKVKDGFPCLYLLKLIL